MSVYHHKKPIVTNGLIFNIDPGNPLSINNVNSARNIVNPLEIGNYINGTSIVNGEYVFDGINDYIDFGSADTAAQLRGTSAFTVSVWVRKINATSSFAIGALIVNSPGWFLQWYSDNRLYVGVRQVGQTNNESTVLTWSN